MRSSSVYMSVYKSNRPHRVVLHACRSIQYQPKPPYTDIQTQKTGPFYQYPLGRLSPYGDEILPLLRHLAKQGKAGMLKIGSSVSVCVHILDIQEGE